MRTEARWRRAGFLLLVAACIAGACACGGKEADKQDAGEGKPAAEAAGQPKIAAAESVFDFGKVKQGVDVEHIFKIRNEGGADLKIEKARGS